MVLAALDSDCLLFWNFHLKIDFDTNVEYEYFLLPGFGEVTSSYFSLWGPSCLDLSTFHPPKQQKRISRPSFSPWETPITIMSTH